jgi:hypothetical protein
MPIAQAMLEKLVFVSNEQAFDANGVARLWSAAVLPDAPALEIRRLDDFNS